MLSAGSAAQPGVPAGHRGPRVPEDPDVLLSAGPKGSVMVLYSDGLQSRWTLDRYPGAAGRDPALMAAVLYRDFARGRDDVTVVAGRGGSPVTAPILTDRDPNRARRRARPPARAADRRGCWASTPRSRPGWRRRCRRSRATPSSTPRAARWRSSWQPTPPTLLITVARPGPGIARLPDVLDGRYRSLDRHGARHRSAPGGCPTGSRSRLGPGRGTAVVLGKSYRVAKAAPSERDWSRG